MSYEGHYQILCRNGHASSMPENYDGGPYLVPQTPEQKREHVGNYAEAGIRVEYTDEPVWKCYYCGELAGWYNMVDDTNGDADGDMTLAEITKEETAVCNMGHAHITKAATYRPHGLVNPQDRQRDKYVNGGLL